MGSGEGDRALSEAVQRLREYLDEVDIDAASLRRDPRGSDWLPAELRALCDRDSGCADELRQFVHDELELFGLSDVGADPFFTARVVHELPPPLRWTGLTPSRRMLLLLAFHLVAGLIAYAVLAWLTPELLTAAADTAHAWLTSPEAGADAGVAGPTAWAAALAVVAGVGLIAFASTKSHTPVA